jgi:RND superfamily putative drug exporter
MVFARLGGFSYRRRWWVLAGWAVVLIAGVALSGQLFDRLHTVDGLRPEAESMRADREIKALVADGPVVYAIVSGRDLYDGPLVESVTAAAFDIAQFPGVVDVDSLYTSPGGRIGTDNASTLVTVQLAEDLPPRDLDAAEDRVRDRLRTIDAPSVLIGGDHLAERAFGEQALRDLAVGESIAFVLLIVALIVFFGGIVAASVPLVVAVVGVSATFLALFGLSALVEVGEYTVNIVTLLGIGLAVDYALLIVARYREELGAGQDPASAVETAMTRAGRAVAISGLAVAVALAGLAAFGEPLLSSMALGGTVVAVLTTALALTAVPALIAVAGVRIPPAGAQTWVQTLIQALVTRARTWGAGAWAMRVLSVRRRGATSSSHEAAPAGEPPSSAGERASLLVRLAGFAQRSPVLVAAVATAGLLALALPLLGATFANSDARTLPRSLSERRAYDAYTALFGAGHAVPVTVVATVDATSPQLRDYLNELLDNPEVFRLDLRHDVPDRAVIVDLTPKGSGGEQSRRLVEDVRAMHAPFPVSVTGPAAEVIDYQESVSSRLPYVVAVVVMAMLGLLFVLTRSLVVAVKAVLLGALTFVATLGALVVLFQWGWGEPVLRFESWGALDVTTPLLLFVFIFGLSMDYEVFLLSRIKEEYDQRPNNDRAVLFGIARSGPVVTAAAACITIVFLGFAAAGLVAVKEIGVGMALAVILDVTVVRGLLLPAVMSLLGDLNWWPGSGRGWSGGVDRRLVRRTVASPISAQR